METHADVIVVGAGPAGAMAAFHLAGKGISVLLLEKSDFPRYKVCGGGLTHKILNEIPFDISPLFESSIHQVQFSCEFKEVFTRSSATPLMYCTMRDKLDAVLLEKAQKAGAKVLFGEKVMNIRQDEHLVTVTSQKNQYHSLLVIGADGASGAVARSAGLRNHLMPGLAWEAEIPVQAGIIQRFSETIFLDWGTFPGGYGWVFPKKDHFSIGVGGPANLSGSMMTYYKRFLDYLNDEGCRISEGLKQEGSTPFSLKSWPIPVRIRKSRFHHGRVLVTGDAAGLTDALTGEGIYYAVRSAKLAADACAAWLRDSRSSLKTYTENVNDTLMGELLEANRIKNIFNAVPLKIHHFVRDHERAWNAFGKVLRGERGYTDVRKGFGTWKFLWGTVCFISKLISARKEKAFKSKGYTGNG